MSSQSFTALMDRVRTTPEWQVEHLGVAFLAQVNERMKALGMSNSALARRMETSPAYVARVFRGDIGLSLKTMLKLAQAVDGVIQVNLVANGQVPPKTGSML